MAEPFSLRIYNELPRYDDTYLHLYTYVLRNDMEDSFRPVHFHASPHIVLRAGQTFLNKYTPPN